MKTFLFGNFLIKTYFFFIFYVGVLVCIYYVEFKIKMTIFFYNVLKILF